MARSNNECIVWNTLRGAQLTNRGCYNDLVNAGIKWNDPCLFVVFVPHDMDEPYFLYEYHYRQVISTNTGRYFIVDSKKEVTCEKEQQPIQSAA
jgi:hypothetical protein